MTQCGECGMRYAPGGGFCPSCGSTRRLDEAPPAPARDPRAAPRRLQARLAGAVLLAVGILGAVQVGSALVDLEGAARGMAPNLAALPGGTFSVEVANATGPVAGAEVALVSADGTPYATSATDAQGRARLDSKAHAFANVTVGVRNLTWSRAGVAMAGETRAMAFDVAQPPGHDPAVATSALLRQTVAWALSVELALLLVLLASGVAALRIRARRLCLTGASFALFLGLVLATAALGFSPAVAVLSLLALASPLVLLIRARQAFAR